MRLISWNVNGLRAVAKKGFLDWVTHETPDILCLQEIKAEADQLPADVREIAGYFSFYNPSRTRKGYSGVAIYSKKQPIDVRYGLDFEEFDQEGRVLIAEYEEMILLNVYFPNGGGGPERLKYKLDFYDAFLVHIEKLRKIGKYIVFCGDINTAHYEIDLARPKENEKNTGFLPEERAWIDELIYHGYVDTFRNFFPRKEGAYSYWDMKTAARERNVGWRIDYFFVAQEFLPKVKSAGIMTQVHGSDHCPIYVDINI
jgi:exodeoxyribonuclease-3